MNRITSSTEERALEEERERQDRYAAQRAAEAEFESLWMFAEIEARERVGFEYADVLEDGVRQAGEKEKR